MKRFPAILLFAALVLNTAPVLASIPDPLREIKAVVFGAESDVQDNRFTYQWNRLNQLVSITSTNANPNFKLDFSYYADGRRAKKVVSTWNGSSWVGSSTNCFYWDKWNMVAETVKKGTNTTVRTYVWGLDLSGQRDGQPGQEAGGIGGLVFIIEKVNTGTPKVYFPVVNNIGSVMMLVDGGTKTVVASYEYSPFGKVLLEKGTARDSCLIRFQSQYYDKETGLIYWKHRCYDPETGRFLSNDPSGEFHGGINLLSAFGNEPVSHIDPDGCAARSITGDFDPQSGMIDEITEECPWWRSQGDPSAWKVLSKSRRQATDDEVLAWLINKIDPVGARISGVAKDVSNVSQPFYHGVDVGLEGISDAGAWLEAVFPMDVQMAYWQATASTPPGVDLLPGIPAFSMAVTTKIGTFVRVGSRWMRFAGVEARIVRAETTLQRLGLISADARAGFADFSNVQESTPVSKLVEMMNERVDLNAGVARTDAELQFLTKRNGEAVAGRYFNDTILKYIRIREGQGRHTLLHEYLHYIIDKRGYKYANEELFIEQFLLKHGKLFNFTESEINNIKTLIEHYK